MKEERDTTTTTTTTTTTWEQLGLDERLIRSCVSRNLLRPTHAQIRSIPLTLKGLDVSCRAHTGSGKTLAYLLPSLHKVFLQEKKKKTSREKTTNPRVIVLVPTRELATQVRKECQEILKHCGDDDEKKYRVGELPQGSSASAAVREAARNCPDVLVSTSARVAQCLKDKLFPPKSVNGDGLEMMVLDECDLLLSFGHEKDIKYIFERCREGVQTVMVSATTTSEEVGNLKSLLLSKPAEVDCDDVEEMEQKEREEREMRKELKKKKKPLITHFGLEIKKGKNDKLLYLMALLRLGLCKKKILIFVKDADEAVRARLFLHKFGVLCVALHSELPANSRAHILEEFNRGVHDVLVAAAEDDSSSNSSNDGSNANEKENAKEEEEEEEEQPTRKSKKERKKEKEKRNQAAKKDSEFGVSRGVDFKKVHTVINFEVPKTFEAYQHRVGRTGRAGATGVAITFFGPSDEEAYHVLLKGYADAAAVAKAAEAKEEDDDEEEDEREEEDVDDFLKPFERLPKEATEALRYRAEDTLRSISKSAVKDARLRELRVELLNSERLASHFEENPDDLNLLRHDSSISKRDDANKHLSHLPAYLRNASKKKRKKNAINAVETEDGDEAKWAAMRLDVDVAEFGQKKKRRRKDKREGGKQKKTREEVGAKVKRKAGRKRSR
ncbi:unnamed protein product [Bathycoccus prasinos]